MHTIFIDVNLHIRNSELFRPTERRQQLSSPVGTVGLSETDSHEVPCFPQDGPRLCPPSRWGLRYRHLAKRRTPSIHPICLEPRSQWHTVYMLLGEVLGNKLGSRGKLP